MTTWNEIENDHHKYKEELEQKIIVEEEVKRQVEGQKRQEHLDKVLKLYERADDYMEFLDVENVLMRVGHKWGEFNGEIIRQKAVDFLPHTFGIGYKLLSNHIPTIEAEFLSNKKFPRLFLQDIRTSLVVKIALIDAQDDDFIQRMRLIIQDENLFSIASAKYFEPFNETVKRDFPSQKGWEWVNPKKFELASQLTQTVLEVSKTDEFKKLFHYKLVERTNQRAEWMGTPQQVREWSNNQIDMFPNLRDNGILPPNQVKKWYLDNAGYKGLSRFFIDLGYKLSE